ncbi:MAG: TetR/AcrR family transcriptional regulator [Acidimicrobiales bacterium]
MTPKGPSTLTGDLLTGDLLPAPPGPARLSPDQVAASQRSRILRAMAGAVGDKGYAATVVADVVARAGVSRQTFYALFAGKEDCFLEAYDAGIRSIVAALERQVDARLPPREQLDRVLGCYLDLMASEPAVARACLIEVFAVGPKALARRQLMTEMFIRLLTELHRRIEIDDRGSDSPDGLVYEALLGSVSSIVTTRVGRGEAALLPGLRQPLGDWLYRALEAF